jgi:hypothetical protein
MLTDLDHIKLADRPLVVCDVDDVVLEFATPFEAFLQERGYRLLPRSFKLTGNIVDGADNALDAVAVKDLIHDFFIEQESRQTAFAEAVDSLHALAAEADLVFLTAMPPRHAEVRRRLLDRLTLSYPMISSEEPKGPIVSALHGGRPLPVAFVDDMVGNLRSVGEHVPECALVYLPPDVAIFRFAPEPDPHVLRAQDWVEARGLIETHFRS